MFTRPANLTDADVRAAADDLRLRRHTPEELLDGPLARLRAALTTAAELREHGLDWVVAPRRAVSGAVVERLGSRTRCRCTRGSKGAASAGGSDPASDPS